MTTKIKLEIEEVRAAIAAVRGFDLQTASIEEIKQALIPVFRGYRVTAPRFASGVALYRARLMGKPQSLRELQYPPANVAPLGRVNREGVPILYCATAREVTFFELAPNVGDTIAIAKWVTTAPLLVNHMGYTRETFDALGSGRAQAGWADRPVDNPGGTDNSEVHSFLADSFAQRVSISERYRYKLTVAIAEKLFADDLFDGLIYPTIAMRANADNVAVKPPYADASLKFRRAEFARVDAVRDLALDITVLDTAVGTDAAGTIQWRGRGDQWELRNQGDQLTMSVEKGRWVARDSNGNIVEPE